MKLYPAQRRAATSRLGRGGFSLVELMLVGGVIALMSVIVSMSMDTLLPKERLNTAVRSLTATLESARSDAIARGLEFYVEYDLDGERYRVLSPFAKEGGRFKKEEMEDDERFSTPWELLPDGVELASVNISGETFSDDRRFIRFDPRGSATDHQVILSQPKYDAFYTIEVMALTGSFKFHRGFFTREAPDDRDFD